jgi:hypothetical protein
VRHDVLCEQSVDCCASRCDIHLLRCRAAIDPSGIEGRGDAIADLDPRDSGADPDDLTGAHERLAETEGIDLTDLEEDLEAGCGTSAATDDQASKAGP